VTYYGFALMEPHLAKFDTAAVERRKLFVVAIRAFKKSLTFGIERP